MKDAVMDLSKLSERQLFGLLEENFRLAAEACDSLANGERGPIYVMLRHYLAVLEGACRQIAAGPNGRGDARWLQIGLKMEDVHKRCGDWLRARQPAWRFRGLGEILRRGQVSAHKLAHRRTGRLGPILPIIGKGPLRENRPVQIILPDGYVRAH